MRIEKEGNAVTKSVAVQKEVPPDVTAQIFWLKNRRPDLWRDKQDLNVEGNINHDNPFDGINTEEIKRALNEK